MGIDEHLTELKKQSMKEIIYISGPYSDPNPLVRDERERQLTIAAAIFAKHGHVVYSPITHSAPLERAGANKSHAEWLEFDLPFMKMCTRCVVLEIDGYAKSEGVKSEINLFWMMNKSVFFILPEGIEDYAERWAK